jgi:hypothetical protein
MVVRVVWRTGQINIVKADHSHIVRHIDFEFDKTLMTAIAR